MSRYLYQAGKPICLFSATSAITKAPLRISGYKFKLQRTSFLPIRTYKLPRAPVCTSMRQYHLGRQNHPRPATPIGRRSTNLDTTRRVSRAAAVTRIWRKFNDRRRWSIKRLTRLYTTTMRSNLHGTNCWNPSDRKLPSGAPEISTHVSRRLFLTDYRHRQNVHSMLNQILYLADVHKARDQLARGVRASRTTQKHQKTEGEELKESFQTNERDRVALHSTQNSILHLTQVQSRPTQVE